MTAIDLFSDPELLRSIKHEFYETVRKKQEERLGKFE
jgi:hypothetical protein